MSSNLTLEAKLAYQHYLDAKTLDDRIEKLQTFISLIPKHKATEKMVALNKTRLSKLKAERDEANQRKKALAAAVEDPFAIKREPQTIQLVMVSDFFEQGQGAGKTTLLRNLTGLSSAKPGVFTAQPLVGIYEWEHVKFQLIEEPALHECQDLPRILGGIQRAEVLALVVDLSRDPLVQMENILRILTDHHIYLNRPPPQIKVEKTGAAGIQVFFLTPSAKESEIHTEFLIDMARAYGAANATVKVFDRVSVQEIEMAFNRNSRYKRAVIVATKADLPNTRENFIHLQEKYGGDFSPSFKVFPVAIIYDETTGQEVRKGLDTFPPDLLIQLNLIRVYTKSKRGVAEKPLVVPQNSSIGDVALKIHRDLYNAFKFAYVYRKTRDNPQMRIRAGLSFLVEDFDIVEIFSRF